MSLNMTPTTILSKVADALVATQQYASVEEALWGLALTAAHNKVVYYQRRIRRLERKYGVDFDTFTCRLQGQATPAAEDDWLRWRSAHNMLIDWRLTYSSTLVL